MKGLHCGAVLIRVYTVYFLDIFNQWQDLFAENIMVKTKFSGIGILRKFVVLINYQGNV